jgi:hypothetical protein
MDNTGVWLGISTLEEERVKRRGRGSRGGDEEGERRGRGVI